MALGNVSWHRKHPASDTALGSAPPPVTWITQTPTSTVKVTKL
jgi:hypothetical protein